MSVDKELVDHICTLAKREALGRDFTVGYLSMPKPPLVISGRRRSGKTTSLVAEFRKSRNGTLFVATALLRRYVIQAFQMPPEEAKRVLVASRYIHDGFPMTREVFIDDWYLIPHADEIFNGLNVVALVR
jgi:hypothetical protein